MYFRLTVVFTLLLASQQRRVVISNSISAADGVIVSRRRANTFVINFWARRWVGNVSRKVVPDLIVFVTGTLVKYSQVYKNGQYFF